ncbi:MAG: phosphatidylglycerophosphatase A [bacterium]|nr:phosphatidylglycerophosphatase A [bacterium]
MRIFILFLASAAGTGFLPVAPGTWGSLFAVFLFVPLSSLAPPSYLLALVGTAVVGVWSAQRAESFFGRHDDGRITIDEVAGQLLALAFLPLRLDVVLLGFGLFRLFDIWKPPPVRQAERLPGGFGVMADDLVAGAYANLIGQIVWRLGFPEGLL